MRILFVSNIFPPHVRGGYELGCQVIAERCRRMGDEVIVATSASIGQLQKTGSTPALRVVELFEPVYEYEPEIVARTAGRPDFHRHWQAAFGGALEHNAWALARFIDEFRPDLVWIFNPLALGPVGVLEACLTSSAPCVLHLMDDIDQQVLTHREEHYLLPRYRRLKSSIHAIACSEKMAIANTRVGEFASMRIIPNGVNFPDALPDFGRRANGPARFVYFGQVERKKGVPQALRGFRALLNRNPSGGAAFEIIGRGALDSHGELEAEIERLGLRETVQVRGFVAREELMIMLPAYTAAVLPLSADEPFGYAPIEAAALGLPVIVGAQVGATEFFPSGYPLFVQDRESERELADRMEWLLQNPTARDETARNLRSHLRRLCDFETVVFPAYRRAIRSLLPTPARHQATALLAAHRTGSFYSCT